MPESKNKLIDSVLCCKKGNFEIRVRCGGHSYEGSSYTSNDGSPFVLIDMMNLNRVSVDLESEVAWVEGGATLGQTYYSISESSKVHGFSAGSCPTVGIGGHISGGGFGLLSRKYGLAADNVVDALLVDADGKLLNRAAMGEDVFWAIRGGGGGIWGVIYAWKIKLIKVPEVVTGFVVSRPGSKRRVLELVDKWQRVSPNLDDEFYLSVFVGAGLPEAKKIGISATFKGFYLGPKKEAVEILSNVFPELGILEGDCKEMSWIESILYFSVKNGSSIFSLRDRFLQNKNYFKAKSDYVRALIPRSGISTAIEILEKEPKGYVILDPYGGAMHKISSEFIPFPHRKVVVQKLVIFVEMARIWGEKYFLKNYDRLVRVKTMIDPLNVFRNQQGIPPLSSGYGKADT
ncbi:hypothetical protein DH2020_020069 [Rehmannia glutinosa]|uniref:FAD-binding PCMH-type domain-containing protein n=1 Tax=Rehmannia glutinosa TaxID=99300 RepID=A0ABR0WJ74_REHGL